MDTLINTTPLPVIGLILVATLVIASLLGKQLWQPGDGRNQSDIGYIVSAALGLQALLIGFTFAVALDRYATRRDLVVTEANAIEMVWLRVDLLPPDQAAPLKRQLRDYAVSRLRFNEAGSDAAQLAAAHAEADRRQIAMWDAVRGIVGTGGNPVVSRVVLDAMGGLVQVAVRREAAARANIPLAVIRTLLIFTITNSLILGYALGGSPRRHRIVGYALFVLLALAVATILDLDRPQGGSIRVPQQPLADLLKRIDLERSAVRPPAPAAAAATRP